VAKYGDSPATRFAIRFVKGISVSPKLRIEQVAKALYRYLLSILLSGSLILAKALRTTVRGDDREGIDMR
jgi:hypothetical protein